MRSLKQSFPQEPLLWVGSREIGDLLLNTGEVDRTISLDAQFFSDLHFSSDQWRDETCDILKTCSHIICWLQDPDEDIAKNIHGYGIQSIIIESPHAESLTSQHVSDRYVETLRDWKVQPVEFFHAREMVSSEEPESGQDIHDPCFFSNSRRIIIQPGSGSPHKCIGFHVLASVVSQLVKKGHECTIVEGPADESAVSRLCAVLPSNTYQVVRDVSLSAVAQRLSSFDLFIGHDSGLAHLAAACGVPSIVLFGPTNPDQWAPQGRHVTVVQGEPCECHDWSSVQRCTHKVCLNISAECVFEQAEYWLSLKNDVTLRRDKAHNLS